jgi:hypothetical protein
MVELAQGHEIMQSGRAAAGTGDHMVDVAQPRGRGAPGEPAVQVASENSPSQVTGDGLGGGADVEREARGGQWPVVQAGPEPGGQAFGAGQDVGSEAEQRAAQPPPGGR